MSLAQVPGTILRRIVYGLVVLGSIAVASAQSPALHGRGTPAAPAPPGTALGDLTWQMAEQRLKADTVVVLPLGAAAQEHGPHLRLRNDLVVAEYLTRRLLEVSDVVAAPTLPYHHFPAFAEYPGSTSLALGTARDLTAEIVRSISRHGPRRFYVLNTGHSSSQALAAAAKLLTMDGVLLRYTDWSARMLATRGVQRQSGGNHGDEIETSMMLYIDAAAVNMSAAVRDYDPTVTTPFQLTRRPGRGTYSPTGIWGDPTLASRDKGRAVVETLVDGIASEIEELRRAPLPVPGSSGATAAPPAPAPPPRQGPARPDGECQPGDDRTIRALGTQFYVAWQDQDSLRLAGYWNDGGDMAHPDGLVESTAQVIRENRTQLFMQREFRGSRHFLTIGTIRCITGDVAIADAKWELRGVSDGRGQPTPPAEGLATLVLKRRRPGGWGIEAWRYNMKPSSVATQPTILKKPGFTSTVK